MKKIAGESLSRIKNLAIVGRAITQAYSQSSQDYGGDLMLAKSALDEFQRSIDLLDMDVEHKQGIQDLIDYLDHKIDRRLSGGEDRVEL